MKMQRLHRFPPLSHVAIRSAGKGDASPGMHMSMADGFQEGLRKGYHEGYQEGYEKGHELGVKEGRSEGHRDGELAARREILHRFDEIAQPVDALLEGLSQLQNDYQSALRKEVVDLVAKVARQVIRCELALQPVQLLALVDETLAAMPATRDEIQVFLNPEELERITELDPVRAGRWALVPDPGLELGEVRVKAGDNEADAGCRQRLAACMERINAQLVESPVEGEVQP